MSDRTTPPAPAAPLDTPPAMHQNPAPAADVVLTRHRTPDNAALYVLRTPVGTVRGASMHEVRERHDKLSLLKQRREARRRAAQQVQFTCRVCGCGEIAIVPEHAYVRLRYDRAHRFWEHQYTEIIDPLEGRALCNTCDEPVPDSVVAALPDLPVEVTGGRARLCD